MLLTQAELVEHLSGLAPDANLSLVKALEAAWGVKVGVAPVEAPRPQITEGTVEQTEFSVQLESVGPNKIAVIKVVREATGLGLKEAKDLVEAAPKTLKDSLPQAEAEGWLKKLEEAGAKAKLV